MDISKTSTGTKVLQILNLLTVLLAVWAGYYVNSGANGTADMKTMSDKYANLLTPAGYAFSIWGLVYLGLFIFAIYQASGFFSKKGNSDVAAKTGIWFILANLCNAAWVFAFSYDQIGLTVLIMTILFISLLRIVQIHNMERWDAQFWTIALLWWPVSLYFGWINVAIIANIACYLTALGWTGAPFNPEVLAIMILIVATTIFITIIWKRNMREYATVGVWGIVAIGINNLESHPTVAWAGFMLAAIIFVNTGVHGYKNRALGPIRRFRPKPIAPVDKL